MTRRKAKAGRKQLSAAARRKAFGEAYIANGGNATQAAITAGYSAKTARAAGSRLLTNVDVSKAIVARHAEVAAITGLSTERTLLEVARIAYSDPRKLYTPAGTLKAIKDWDDESAAVVASVETEDSRAAVRDSGEVEESSQVKKLKLWDKNTALGNAMRFHGMFREDNLQQRGPPTTILIEYV